MPPNLIDIITQAARQKHLLEIRYLDREGNPQEPTLVEPYSWSGVEPNQALFAWEINRGGMWRFELSRIAEVREVDTEFVPRYDIEIA